jgi:hypothetical protein
MFAVAGSQGYDPESSAANTRETMIMGALIGSGRLLAIGLVVVVAGCASETELGTGGSMVTGSGGAAGTQGAASELVRCDRPLGTAALVEPEHNTIVLLNSVGLQSPIPLLRLMMAQSNCFQVVDRGAALSNIQTEDRLRASGMLQEGATTARGRMVTTQYLVTPNIIFSNPNAGGMGAGAALGGLFGAPGLIVGAIAGSMRIQEAQTALFLTDAQSGLQTAVAEGSAKVRDFGGVGGLGGFGGSIGGFGGISGYGNTAEGKLIAAALLDAHNKLVQQVRVTQPNLPTVMPRTSADSSAGPPPLRLGGAYATVTTINIRSGPGTGHGVVGQARPGVALVATGEEDGGWWMVQGADVTGWVAARNLRELR